MTIQRPSNFTIFLIVVILILGWVLFSRGCGPGVQPSVNDNKATKDSIALLRSLNKKRADSIRVLKEKDEYSISVIEEMGTMFFQADSTAQSKSEQLKKTQNQLALAKSSKDTLAQLRECDTLTMQVTELREKFKDASNVCDEYVVKSSRELYHKDSIIEIQDRQIAGLQRQGDLADTLIKHTLPSVRPPLLRGWLGVTAAVGAYNSFGVDLHLLNRKNVMYKGAVKLGNGGFSYEAGISKFISLKKR